MAEIGFAPKEVIPQQVCRLEVMAADKAETFGLQIGLKLKIIGGKHDSHYFTDYANRDENSGLIKEGSKAWSIFEACLGRDFHKQPSVSLKSLVGKQFVAQVTQTRTGSRNKIEHGSVRPGPLEEAKEAPKRSDSDDGMFDDLPI